MAMKLGIVGGILMDGVWKLFNFSQDETAIFLQYHAEFCHLTSDTVNGLIHRWMGVLFCQTFRGISN